jgi:hypothetical protein
MKTLDNENRVLLFKLKDLGIAYIQAYYEGGGDSGAIEDLLYVDNKKAIEEDLNFNKLCEDNYINHRSCGIDFEIDSSLDSLIEDLIYGLLENVEDWYNNDGGFGTVYINISTGEYSINNNVRYTETHFYGHSGSII